MMNRRFTAWKLVCGALAPESGPRALSGLLDEYVSCVELWPQIVGWADAHLVTPAVYVGLREKGLLGRLPEDSHRYLESVYEMNSDRNAALLRQLDEAIHLLNASGVVPVLLKGSAYLKTGVFEDPAARVLADLDILVGPEEIATTVEALRGVGYEEMQDEEMDWNRHHHHAPLFRPGDFGGIEVHRRPLDDVADEILPTETVQSELIDQNQGGLRFRCLSPTHTALVSFLHSQITDRFGARHIIGLRPLQDLLALDRRYRERVDWKAILDLLERHGKLRLLSDYMYAGWRLAGVQVLPEVRFGLRERVHFCICLATVRWKTLADLAPHVDEFSAYGIRKIYGNEQNRWTLSYYRLVRAGRKIARSWRMLPVGRDRFGRRQRFWSMVFLVVVALFILVG